MAAAAAIGGGLFCMISLSGSLAYAMSGNAASNVATSGTTTPAASNVGASGNAASNVATSGTTTPPANPKATLIATGQAIQVAEVDISTAPPAFTAPTGIVTTAPISYTFSMDVNIAQTGTSWRNIMAHGANDGDRRPSVFISGTDFAPANRIHIIHAANEDANKHIITTLAAPLATYFNLTFVVSGGKLITYINGVKAAGGETTGTFNWGTYSATNWAWNAYKTYYPGRAANVAGAVKVKNAYWFNKGLTDAEITTLATPSSSTTSTFVPEPYNL